VLAEEKFVIAKLPVGTVHVGCVTRPRAGTAGAEGLGLIVLLAEFNEVHPFFEAFKVYVPGGAVTIPVPEIFVPADGVIVYVFVAE
jgi:hypothetical protein